jgi:hypothetical protein
MVLRLFKRLFRALRIGDYGSARNESINRADIETVTDLPDSCLRGLRKQDWVDDRFIISAAAFEPDSRTAAGRKDGGKETSVNWEDDSKVESFTFEDKINAQYGAARISTTQIVQTSNTAAALATPLSCERQRLPGNQYHGNIVYSANLNKRMERLLAASLALKSSFVSPPWASSK